MPRRASICLIIGAPSKREPCLSRVSSKSWGISNRGVAVERGLDKLSNLCMGTDLCNMVVRGLL